MGAKADFVQKVIDGDLDLDNLDLSLVANIAKKKKREKRGPNKWMPMRRAVDQEVKERINNALGIDETKTTPKENKKKDKTPKSAKRQKSSAKKRIQVQDSSDNEDVIERGSGTNDSETESKQEPSSKRKGFLDSESSSDEGVDDPMPQKRPPSENDKDSSDDEVVAKPKASSKTKVQKKSLSKSSIMDSDSSGSDNDVKNTKNRSRYVHSMQN